MNRLRRRCAFATFSTPAPGQAACRPGSGRTRPFGNTAAIATAASPAIIEPMDVGHERRQQHPGADAQARHRLPPAEDRDEPAGQRGDRHRRHAHAG